MCGSILLLNKNSEPYHKVHRDGKYCKLVELRAEYILNNGNALEDDEERLRLMELVS